MNEELRNEIILHLQSTSMNDTEIAEKLSHKYNGKIDSLRRYIRDQRIRLNLPKAEDREIVEETVKIAKQKQKQQDTNRIERKAFREYSRLENALAEYNKELVDILKEHTQPIKFKQYKTVKGDAVLVVHISDTHFNELVNLPHNKYDFTVASKRLRKLAGKIKQYAKTSNINNVFIAFTGDLMNSDRRLDELLSMATNRAKATYLSFLLLEQFIYDISEIGQITMASVSGNESRAKDEKGFSEIVVSDSYDVSIWNMLKVGLRDKNVNFIEGDNAEQVVNIAGQNVLLLHGEGLEKDTQKKVHQIVGKYVARGYHINFVLYGHVHSAYISDMFARNSSIVGSNSYNENALFLTSKASQNIHLFHRNTDIDSIKVDLQHTDNEGYDIVKELEAYNTKSADKVKPKKTVFEVVV